MEDLNLVSMVVISHLFFFCNRPVNKFIPSWHLPAQINNRNTRTRCKKCSKLTIKTPEQN